MTDKEEKQVTVQMQNRHTGSILHHEVTVSKAISMVKAGRATYHGSLEDLEAAHRHYLLGDNLIGQDVQESLSFFLKFKPIIDSVVRIIQIAKSFWSNFWWLISALAALVTLWLAWPILFPHHTLPTTRQQAQTFHHPGNPATGQASVKSIQKPHPQVP